MINMIKMIKTAKTLELTEKHKRSGRLVASFRKPAENMVFFHSVMMA